MAAGPSSFLVSCDRNAKIDAGAAGLGAAAAVDPVAVNPENPPNTEVMAEEAWMVRDGHVSEVSLG